MKTFLRILLTLSLVQVSAWAQQQSQIQQVQDTEKLRRIREKEEEILYSDSKKDSVPEIIPGETADTGPQFIVQSKKVRKYFEASVDSQFYYTSNLFLQEKDPIDTTVLVSTAQFAVAPDPYDLWEGKFYPKLGFRHQWYNYGIESTSPTMIGVEVNNFDFDAQTVFLDLRYQIWEDWTFSGGFDWQRLLTHEKPARDYSEFYKSYTPNWGVERQFVLNDDMAISLGYRGTFSFTDEKNINDGDRNDRLDNSFTASYMWQAMEGLILQPYGRVQHTYYTRYKDPVQGQLREDYLYSAGISVVYMFNENIVVRTFLSMDHRESEDITISDYTKWDGGLGLSLTYRF